MSDAQQLMEQLVHANLSCAAAVRLLQQTPAYTAFVERVARLHALRDQLRGELATRPRSLRVTGCQASYKQVRTRSGLGLTPEQLTQLFGSSEAALAFVLSTHRLDPKALDRVFDQKTIPADTSERIQRSIKVVIRPRFTLKLQNYFADLLPSM